MFPGILTPIIKRRISSRSNSGTSKTSDDATAADSRKRPKLGLWFLNSQTFIFDTQVSLITKAKH